MKTESLSKKKYRNFCATEASIPIFSKDWWLDSVCGKENWDVVLVERNQQIVASLPFYKKKKWYCNLITMPKLTQTMGPYIKYPEKQRYAKKLSYEKKIMVELIKKLPNYTIFIQNFHYSISNWLPFYWHDYKQTTNYTYVIDRLDNLTKVFENFSHAKRKDINKAEKNVQIYYDLPAEKFYENHKLILEKQNKKIDYPFDLFNFLYNAVCSHNAGKIFYAIDKNNNLHSALFVVWDSESAYDLISIINPKFRNSGSASFLIKEAISYVAKFTKKFDFEGSMIEQVEQSFRQFGAKQIPYFQITKITNIWLKSVMNFLNIVKRKKWKFL